MGTKDFPPDVYGFYSAHEVQPEAGFRGVDTSGTSGWVTLAVARA